MAEPALPRCRVLVPEAGLGQPHSATVLYLVLAGLALGRMGLVTGYRKALVMEIKDNITILIPTRCAVQFSAMQ